MSILFNDEKINMLYRKCICFKGLHSEWFNRSDKQIALWSQMSSPSEFQLPITFQPEI